MTPSLRTRAIAVLLATHVAACAGDDHAAPDDPESSSTAQLQACDPLQREEQPVALGEVLAVGRDGDGVLYVLVQPDQGDYQVFVSEHGALRTPGHRRSTG